MHAKIVRDSLARKYGKITPEASEDEEVDDEEIEEEEEEEDVDDDDVEDEEEGPEHDFDVSSKLYNFVTKFRYVCCNIMIPKKTFKGHVLYDINLFTIFSPRNDMVTSLQLYPQNSLVMKLQMRRKM